MRASSVLVILAALSSASHAEECSALESEEVPSLIQANKQASSSKDTNKAQIGVNSWAGKFPMLTKVPVSPDSTGLAEVNVGTKSMDLSKVGLRKLPEEMIFHDVFKGVDLVVSALDAYKAREPNRNGNYKGYGAINLLGGTSTTFKFQFTKTGTKTPVVINKLYFTMANIDSSGSLTPEVSMLTAFDNVFLPPVSNVRWHQRNGSTPSLFVGTGHEERSAAFLQEERANTMTWSFLSVSELRMKLGTPGGSNMEGRSFYFAGKSSLTKQNCMKFAEMTALKFGATEYSNLGGFGPSIGSPRAIRYSKVTTVDDHDVDMIVKNTGGMYRPVDPMTNGARDGFAVLSVSSGMNVNFSFAFVKHGGMEAVQVPDLALSLHDIDRAPEHGPATSILAKSFKRAYLSENTEFIEMEPIGGGWYSFNHRFQDHGLSSRSFPKTPLRLTEQQQARSVSMEWPDASFVNVGFQMDGSDAEWSRNLYISGVSRLTASRETPFVCT